MTFTVSTFINTFTFITQIYIYRVHRYFKVDLVTSYIYKLIPIDF